MAAANQLTFGDVEVVGTISSDAVQLPMEALGDVTSSRSTGEVYQNDTEYPLSVDVVGSDSAGERVALVLTAGQSSDSLSRIAANSDAGNGSDTTYTSVNATIPPGT